MVEPWCQDSAEGHVQGDQPLSCPGSWGTWRAWGSILWICGVGPLVYRGRWHSLSLALVAGAQSGHKTCFSFGEHFFMLQPCLGSHDTPHPEFCLTHKASWTFSFVSVDIPFQVYLGSPSSLSCPYSPLSLSCFSLERALYVLDEFSTIHSWIDCG